MSRLKYVMFTDDDFLIFPGNMSHKVVAAGQDVKSAGYVRLSPKEDDKYETEASCFGKSDTLGIKSDPQHDSLIISIALRID